MNEEPGRRFVDGRFELLDRLGSGGMGTVWRARDLALHREVALKEVRPADPALMEGDPSRAALLRERVLREAWALARLQHPHVVTIHQIIEAPDTPYPWIVMELVRGTSLQERLEHGPLAAQEAARLGRGVLSALRAAHAAGIHHRDVKPANILLRTDGSPVLTDFGIAALRDATTLTATGEMIGSPEYIAPERLRGDETRTASDLWSLGMLLYVAVEGYHPLRRATTMATLVAVMSDPVPPPKRAGALAPALVSVLVADPEARPSSEQFDELLAAADAPPAAHTTVPSAHRRRPSSPDAGTAGAGRRTRRIRRAGLVVAAGVIACLVGYSLIQGNSGSGAAASDLPLPHRTPTASSGTTAPAAAPASSAASTAGPTASLLTPAGAKVAVAALRAAAGSDKVTELDLYPSYANADVPSQTQQGVYDIYQYRDGLASPNGPGGTVDSGTTVVDLKTVRWDALTALWLAAEKQLGIPKPTMSYVAVRGDVITGVPAVLLYLSDNYGSAYLEANVQGKVVRLYPRHS
nr:serine/threonine-protein kinase [Streptomyces sp. 846.5]